MTTLAPRVRPGTDIAPGYRVLGLLRRGEDVDVYDVWSAERECRCVVKALRPERIDDRRARRRLLTEGRRLAAFTHPGLVRTYEVVERPAPQIILETLTGETLGYIIAGEGPRVPVFELGALGVQLCSVLGYLHRNDVLHLDVKPSNIICQADQAKLIDLGIARPPGRGSRGVGSPPYMAPEQYSGGRLSAATDVWGVGATLYEAASTRQPFGGTGVGGATGPAEPLRRYRRLPRPVTDAIDACLAIAPVDRPSIAELAKTLREVAV